LCQRHVRCTVLPLTLPARQSSTLFPYTTVFRSIEAAGGKAIWVQADVSDPKAVSRLFDACEKEFGGVDVAVANAGIMHLGAFSRSEEHTLNSSHVKISYAVFCLKKKRWHPR